MFFLVNHIYSFNSTASNAFLTRCVFWTIPGLISRLTVVKDLLRSYRKSMVSSDYVLFEVLTWFLLQFRSVEVAQYVRIGVNWQWPMRNREVIKRWFDDDVRCFFCTRAEWKKMCIHKTLGVEQILINYRSMPVVHSFHSRGSGAICLQNFFQKSTSKSLIFRHFYASWMVSSTWQFPYVRNT